MKNKGFKWLLTILSEVSANIRVLDTYVMRNFLATDFFYLENHRMDHRKVGCELTGKEVLQEITAERSFYRTAKSTQAIGYLRGGRIYFTDSLLQDYFANPYHNFTYIQKCSSQCSESCNLFTASIVLSNNKYDFNLYFFHEGIKTKAKNIIWVQRVKDMLNSINILVQEKTNTRLKKAKYELIKDEDDFFWISYFYSTEFEKLSHEIPKSQYTYIETPIQSEDSSINSSKDSIQRQLSVKRVTVGKSAEPFNSDFLELICRKRIKERRSPELKLPSRLFYAEHEEVNAEKVKIMKMMSDRNLTSKSTKNEKLPRRTMWLEPTPRKSHFGSPLPRVSSPMFLNPDLQFLSATRTPLPISNSLQAQTSISTLALPLVPFGLQKPIKKLSLKRLGLLS